jgi:predicted nucleic acid-binding protein
MAWVVDTCVLLDVLEGDPEFGEASARALDRLAEDGLTICPITYTELAPAFEGNLLVQDEFLSEVGVDFRQDWLWEDTIRSNEAWHGLVQRKRKVLTPKRPIADVLIGSFASRHQGLITRNQSDFAAILPSLPIQNPLQTER